jgi:hypothetical protein
MAARWLVWGPSHKNLMPCCGAVPPQFAALPAANALSGQPITPGSKVLLKSLKTNKFCRVVDTGNAEQIKCDVDDPAQATPIDYTGTSFTYKVTSESVTRTQARN